MNKKHITRFMENKASFNKYTSKNRVPRWYVQLRIEDDKCEYPFALFPYLHKDPKPWLFELQNDEIDNTLNGTISIGNTYYSIPAYNTQSCGPRLRREALDQASGRAGVPPPT